MFFHLSKEKLIKMTAIVVLILMATIFSFFLNDHFQIAKAYGLNANKFKQQVSYFWSHKLIDYVKNPKSILASALVSQMTEMQQIAEPAYSVPVLVYHGLPNEGVGQLPHDRFVEQMRALKNNGWQTISMADFKDFMAGKIVLPQKSFLLTYDDGRKDSFYPADPVLRDLGFNAVMFAISKKSASETTGEDSNYYLSPYELVQLERSGRWEVESHGRDSHDWYALDEQGTIGHFFSNRFWSPIKNDIESEEEFRHRVKYDLLNSKKDLENILNKQITTFAFPFGDFGQDTVNYSGAVAVIQEEVPKIYEYAFYQTWSGMGELFNYPNDNFMIKRIEPSPEWSGDFLVDFLDKSMVKHLPYEALDFGDSWMESWGLVNNGETLLLGASASSTGAATSLAGSWLWRDYLLLVDVNWEAGSNIVLIARRYNDRDYYGCNFAKDRVSIKKVYQNSSHNVVSKKYPLSNLGEYPSFGIKVVGEDISCLVNGVVALYEPKINKDYPNGGIGLEIWDSEIGVAKAAFDNIRVTPE